MNPTVRIDLDDPTPPYEQLRRQFAFYIETGQLAPDERLPPLRQLARDLGLAVGTVARTYRELEAANLVRSRRGGGTRVLLQERSQGTGQVRLSEAARAYAQIARALGVSTAEARQAVEIALAASNTLTGPRAPD